MLGPNLPLLIHCIFTPLSHIYHMGSLLNSQVRAGSYFGNTREEENYVLPQKFSLSISVRYHVRVYYDMLCHLQDCLLSQIGGQLSPPV